MEFFFLFSSNMRWMVENEAQQIKNHVIASGSFVAHFWELS